MRDMFKARPVTMKAIADADQPGTFEAYVSIFNNVDSDGEIVKPGAFTKTLAEGPKAIVYSHDWVSVPIGQTLEATETNEGLLVKGRLFVADDEDHARAREVYAAMRAGALKEFSFGGRVLKETRVEDPDTGDVTWELDEIDLVEYGPCLKGANPATRLLAVKSMVQADVITREEARSALGLHAAAKADDDIAEVTETASELSDTNGDGVDTDGAEVVETPTEDATDWGETLAAVRANVLTISEARERLGLPPKPKDDTLVDSAEGGDAQASSHGAAVAALDLAAA